MAPLIWERLGRVSKYIEPFAGSLAVLLGNPFPAGHEVVNDLDGFVCNVWRAIKHDPVAVAHWADDLAHECDLHARHMWLTTRRETLTRALEGDPDYYDAKIAGWWLWGIASWIGGGWCSTQNGGPWHVVDGHLVRGQGDIDGVQRKRLHVRNTGMGVQRRRLHIRNTGVGVQRISLRTSSSISSCDLQHGEATNLLLYCEALCARLRSVQITCGDWQRIVSPGTINNKGSVVGIVLDPPYSGDERDKDIYSTDNEMIATAVAQWAREHGANPFLRIALCGYEGEHDMPREWDVVKWKTGGGYAKGDTQATRNRQRERIWFSPGCLGPTQPGLL